MIGKIVNIFKVKDLRKKLFFTFSLLVVFRLGGQVPIPGLGDLNLDFSGSILGLYDSFVGNFLSQASIFSLGIMPYISFNNNTVDDCNCAILSKT